MSLDWNGLRLLDGSVRTAFEELCVQLASCELTCPIGGAERIPDGSTFVRKGAPDAGVECYWKLPDGSEIAWQAKYFRNRSRARMAKPAQKRRFPDNHARFGPVLCDIESRNARIYRVSGP